MESIDNKVTSIDNQVKPFEYRDYCLFAMAYSSTRNIYVRQESQRNHIVAFSKLNNSELWRRFIDLSVPEKDFWLVVRKGKVDEYLLNGLQNLVYRDDYIYENYVLHYFMLTLKYSNRKLPLELPLK